MNILDDDVTKTRMRACNFCRGLSVIQGKSDRLYDSLVMFYMITYSSHKFGVRDSILYLITSSAAPAAHPLTIFNHVETTT